MHLIYHHDMAEWLTNGIFTKDEMIAIMENHIKTFVSRYKGRIHEWLVVNEAVWAYQGTTGYSDSIWYKKIGAEYIELSFKAAREADPNAILIYNDYGNETAGLKSNVVFNIVESLKQENLVDAVGMQFHIAPSPLVPSDNIDPTTLPSKADLIAQMKRYGDIGVRVVVTELDVDISKLPGTKDEKLAQQAEIYKLVIEACFESGVCDSVTTWGINDETCWLQKIGGQSPCLFSEYQPKPAYYAIVQVLYKQLP